MKKSHFLSNLIFIFAFLSAFFLPFKFSNTKKVYADDNANFTNLIVFARFNNESEFINNTVYDTTTVKQLINNSYSLADYSVKDYYYRVSNGKVNMQNVYLFGENQSSLVLEHNRGYYFEKSDTNLEGYEASEYSLRVSELQQDWANAIKLSLESGNKITNIDGTETYSVDDLDKNGDGKIDSITIIYKYSTDFAISWKDCLWNYQSYSNRIELVGKNNQTILSNAYLQLTYDYSYSYINENGNLRFANLKTMIHETGHIFGLKDLYNSQSASPVYYMSLMAKAIAPVPQYLSAKEREVLGWLNNDNIKQISKAGKYTLSVSSSSLETGVISYKCDIPSSNKTLYLEYRKFDGEINKYDSLSKVLYDKNNEKMKNISIKSGLVCYLIDKDTIFPNNMNCNQYNWNYQVLGGQYQTKTDSALAENESLTITSNLSVQVESLNDYELTFILTGTDINETHTHNLLKVEYKDSTCKVEGNIEYFKCPDCDKYFLNDGTEIDFEDTIIALKPHKEVKISGKPATCTEKGLTNGIKCEICEKIIVQQEEIDKLNHIESDWIIDKNATNFETGLKHTECVNCREILNTEIIPILTDDINSDPIIPPSSSNNKNSTKQTIIVISISLIATISVISLIIIFCKINKKRKRKNFI